MTALDRLRDELGRYPRLAVAVSGGVDSLTLAAVGHQVLGSQMLAVHALSPAVPPEATQRVVDHARRFDWPAKLVEAGEFEDQRYRDNPVNRCYFCKTNLYQRLREVWSGPIASGANLDDLGDYRPGLLAASENGVVHPLIEAQISKQTVRAIAFELGLEDVAELPAQPCLSSRVETGIAIRADDLVFVHRVERFLSLALGAGNIRCRITAAGVRIEVPSDLIAKCGDQWNGVRASVLELIHSDNRVSAGFSEYARGSAFIGRDIA